VWRHIAHSQQGAGHLGDGSPCQDAHSIRLLSKEGHDVLVACIADGAGSARFGDVGSLIACAAVMDQAVTYFEAQGRFDELGHDEAVRWCNEARGRIEAEALVRECAPRELATTLCAAVITPSCAHLFQIGDGAIVLCSHGAYGVVFWPQSGEYANSTNFLTSDEYRQRIEFTTTTSRFSDIALLTDGLERLALRFDLRTPHTPFFEPLFRALRATDDVEGLNEALRRFLASDSVIIRSDDDKTLILASRYADGFTDIA
jgi:serine/threonine protein phosphatase PrpC